MWKFHLLLCLDIPIVHRHCWLNDVRPFLRVSGASIFLPCRSQRKKNCTKAEANATLNALISAMQTLTHSMTLRSHLRSILNWQWHCWNGEHGTWAPASFNNKLWQATQMNLIYALGRARLVITRQRFFTIINHARILIVDWVQLLCQSSNLERCIVWMLAPQGLERSAMASWLFRG